MTCTLCRGIKRLNQHLAGGYGDSAKTTTAIRKEMRDYLEGNRRRSPLFLEDDEQEDDVVVVEADPAESVQVKSSAPTSQGSKMQPSSGTAVKQRCADYLFKAPASKSKTKLKQQSVLVMLRKTLEEVVDERRKGISKPTISAKMKTKEEKHYVDMQWPLLFYECGVPFNAEVAARQFQIAVEAIMQFGSRYKPPSLPSTYFGSHYFKMLLS